MKKFSLLLSVLLLNGCIGRTIVYEPDLQNNQNKTGNITTQKSSQVLTDNQYLNFILKQNYKLKPEDATKLLNYIIKACEDNNIEPKLALALMARESSFRADVTSPSGAIGLGQLLKSTAKDMGTEDPYNPEENSKATVKYISYLMKQWNGNVDLALASYKIGIGTVKKLLNDKKEIPSDTWKYIFDIKAYMNKISG